MNPNDLKKILKDETEMNKDVKKQEITHMDWTMWLEKILTMFEKTFRAICVFCAAAMCIYCIVDYVRNEDLTEVSFVKFEGNDMNRYPEISLCFSGQFPESELKKINENFTTIGYHEFLMGRAWDPRMVELDYGKIAIKPEDHLLHTCAQSAYGGRCI